MLTCPNCGVSPLTHAIREMHYHDRGGLDMTVGWNDNTPIYRQLKERVVGMMLDGDLKAGDALLAGDGRRLAGADRVDDRGAGGFLGRTV